MKLNRKRQPLLLVMVAITLASLILVGCAGPAPTPTPPTKVVELVVAQHSDVTGPLRQGGIPMGCADYYKYVNEEKLLGENVRIVHIWTDDHYESDKTLSFYRSVKQRNPVLFHSDHTTGNIVLKPLLEKDGVPSISIAPASVGTYPPATLYSTSPTYPDMAAMFMDYLLETLDEPPKIAFLSGDNPFGREPDIPSVYEYAEQHGVEIVTAEYVPPLPVDVTVNLRRIEELGANAIWTNSTDITLLPCMKDAVRLGIRDKFVWGTCSFCSFSRVLLAAEDDPEIAEGIEGLFTPFAYAMFSETDIPGVKFMKELALRYRGADDLGGDNLYYCFGLTQAITGIEAIRLALEEVPADQLTGRDVIEQGFSRMKDFEPMGLNQALESYGEDMPRNGVTTAIPAVIQNGKFVRIAVELYPHGLH